MAVRAAAGAEQRDQAHRSECEWQRAQLPDEIRQLVLDDQRLRNDRFRRLPGAAAGVESLFDC
jgi:hypothetical protein